MEVTRLNWKNWLSFAKRRERERAPLQCNLTRLVACVQVFDQLELFSIIFAIND